MRVLGFACSNGGVWKRTAGGMEDSARGVRGAATVRGKCEARGAGRVLPGGASSAADGPGSPGAHYTRRAHQDHGVEVEPGEMEVGFNFWKTWEENGWRRGFDEHWQCCGSCMCIRVYA